MKRQIIDQPKDPFHRSFFWWMLRQKRQREKFDCIEFFPSRMSQTAIAFSLQRKKRLAFCLSVRGFTNPPICQTFSNNAGYRLRHTFRIARLAGVPFVIPLAEIAV